MKSVLYTTAMCIKIGFAIISLIQSTAFGENRPAKITLEKPPEVRVEKVEVIKEVPVEKVVTKFEATPDAPFIEWHPDLLRTGVPAAAMKEQAISDVYWEIETNPGCPLCGQNWQTVQTHLTQPKYNWVFGDAGYFRSREVLFDKPLPVWKLYSGDRVVEERKGTQDAIYLSNRIARELANAPARAPALPVTTVNGGKISQEEWDKFAIGLKILGQSGLIQGSSKVPVTLNLNGVPVTFQPMTKVQLTPGSGANSFNATFTPKVTASWAGINTALSGVKYDGFDKVEIETFLSMFNPVLTIE